MLFYFVCSIEIEVEYYEKEKEIMTKVESLVIIAQDVPLREVFMASPFLLKVRLSVCMHGPSHNPATLLHPVVAGLHGL